MVKVITDDSLANLPTVAIAAKIDAMAAQGKGRDLLDYLPEQFYGYHGRSSGEINRIKGYTFAAFLKTGLPDEAIPFVLDELENGLDAYLVAGAARALRGLNHALPAASSYLIKAFYNMLFMDDALSFESFNVKYPLSSYTTPLSEILETMKWLKVEDKHTLDALEKVYAVHQNILSKSAKTLLLETIELSRPHISVENDCCAIPLHAPVHTFIHKRRMRREVQEQVRLEDQDEQALSYNDFFTSGFTVLIFFYTRCDNPNKCSLSVSRFSRLQYLLEEKRLNQIRLAGITYDAGYDVSSRLKSYGDNRGFAFNRQQRFFRVTSGFETLRSYLNLGVNYAGSVVNNHAIELYILDKKGNVKVAQTRLQWNPEEIRDILISLLSKKESVSIRKVLRIAGNTLSGILIAFFPKCPVCWAGYMSLFGAIGLQSIPYTPQLFYVVLMGMLLNLYVNYRTCRKKNIRNAFYINVLGCFLVITGYLWKFQFAIYGGIVALLISSMYINLSGIFQSLFRNKNNQRIWLSQETGRQFRSTELQDLKLK
ncbi:SCO family protein [Pedobacter caeni]|uniref:Protein SCO1/2 n=1 Tax=Pedobacter caeni TaxID=288992 RepID=A0A1M5KT92_9SPHI|nr:SCO family protein [Pedobacter caeni]SHG55729.1 protein SCO1/2 [Pedobacter caeni]